MPPLPSWWKIMWTDTTVCFFITHICWALCLAKQEIQPALLYDIFHLWGSYWTLYSRKHVHVEGEELSLKRICKWLCALYISVANSLKHAIYINCGIFWWTDYGYQFSSLNFLFVLILSTWLLRPPSCIITQSLEAFQAIFHQYCRVMCRLADGSKFVEFFNALCLSHIDPVSGQLVK